MRRCKLWDLLAMAGLVIVTLASALPLFLKFPPPGMDEVAFVDPAATLATTGRLATDLYRDLIPGMATHVYWQPPLYFVMLAGWFRIFGIGLIQARTFSLLSGVGVVLLIYGLVRNWGSPEIAVVPAGLCAISLWFLNAARYGRMDSLCVFFVLLATLAYVRGLGSKSRWRMAGAALFAGLAFLTHPLGAMAPAAILVDMAKEKRLRVFMSRDLYVVVSIVGLLAIIWIAYIALDPDSFRQQWHLQLARKASSRPFYIQYYWAKTHALTLLAASFAVGWLFIEGAAEQRSRFVLLMAILMFLAGTYGREIFYLFYFYPLFLVALGICLARDGPRRMICAAIVLAFFNEAAIWINDYRRHHGEDYLIAARTFRQYIPAQKEVFMSYSAVFPYFALYGRNPMRLMPPVPLKTGCVLNAAMKSDYLVFSPDMNRDLLYVTSDEILIATIRWGSSSVAIYKLRP